LSGAAAAAETAITVGTAAAIPVAAIPIPAADHAYATPPGYHPEVFSCSSIQRIRDDNKADSWYNSSDIPEK
jgi:hypothetical protein